MSEGPTCSSEGPNPHTQFSFPFHPCHFLDFPPFLHFRTGRNHAPRADGPATARPAAAFWRRRACRKQRSSSAATAAADGDPERRGAASHADGVPWDGAGNDGVRRTRRWRRARASGRPGGAAGHDAEDDAAAAAADAAATTGNDAAISTDEGAARGFGEKYGIYLVLLENKTYLLFKNSEKEGGRV